MNSLDLGGVGNCSIASLIDRKGRHVWHGLGRLDFTVTALNRLPATRTMESYVRFIVDIVEAGSSRGEVHTIAPLFPIAPAATPWSG